VGFVRGTLADGLETEAVPRETLWPAMAFVQDGKVRVRPLAWKSSGDITCLARANALFRMAPGCQTLGADAEVEFLPTGGSLLGNNS
jgi:molybdopterin biosynthesis enzyme